MKKYTILFLTVLLLLGGCDAGNLGLYVYPPSGKKTGDIEEMTEPKVAGTIRVKSAVPVPQESFEVVGYLPLYQMQNVEPAVAQNLTDLVYFNFWVHADGTFSSSDMTQSHLEFLRKVQNQYNVRVLIGIAENEKKGSLLKVSSSATLRAKFVREFTAYLVDMRFDGADFDWEFPAEEDLSHYTDLLVDLKKAFVDHQLKLTAAVSPSRPLEKAAFDAVDRIHAMLYDDWGRHSTMTNSAYHIKEMVDQGASKQKIQLGVPFYGRGYTTRGPSWDSALSYRTLKERYNIKPGQDTVSGYYFNNAETVREKVRYAKNEGLSGVMVWELGQDTDDSSSLLKAIAEERKNF